MVKGLKVLRHKQTEAGYFNEFLIAKTPDDVENCAPQPIVTFGNTAMTRAIVYSTVISHPNTSSTIDRAPAVGSVPAAQQLASCTASTMAGQTYSSDDNVRRAKRRERNRVAAAKCRKKRQDQLESLSDAAKELEAANSDLEQQVAELDNVKRQLLELVRSHQLECPEGLQLPVEFANDDDDDVIDCQNGGLGQDGEMIMLEAGPCFSPPMVTCASPPPVWHQATVATRPNDLLLPPEPMDTNLATLTTPIVTLTTPVISLTTPSVALATPTTVKLEPRV